MGTQYALTKKNPVLHLPPSSLSPSLSPPFIADKCMRERQNKSRERERERTKRQSQRHKREWVTKQIPGWDLRALLPVLISIPKSSGFCQSRTQQPYSPRREPAGHYPQTPAQSQLFSYHNHKNESWSQASLKYRVITECVLKPDLLNLN